MMYTNIIIYKSLRVSRIKHLYLRIVGHDSMSSEHLFKIFLFYNDNILICILHMVSLFKYFLKQIFKYKLYNVA